MKTKEAIEYFGTQVVLADAIGIGQSSISEWGEYPPDLRQLQIQAITVGRLMAEPDCLPTTKPVAARVA